MPENRFTKTVSTRKDANQTLQKSFNDADNSLTVTGVISAKIGLKVSASNTAPGDLGLGLSGTDFTYEDNGVLMYTIRVLYSDGDREIFLSAERVA